MTEYDRRYVPPRPDPDPSWREHAACRGMDPNLFHSDRGDDGLEAKKVCASCEVRLDCLTYAVRAREPMGIWGGYAPRARQRMRADRVPTTLRLPQPHGTRAKYAAGCHCATCRAAAAAYRRQFRRRGGTLKTEPLTADALTRLAAELSGEPESEITQHYGTIHVRHIRHGMWAAARDLLGMSYLALARAYDRDHRTIMHGVNAAAAHARAAYWHRHIVATALDRWPDAMVAQ